jgi:hypothetical protein
VTPGDDIAEFRVSGFAFKVRGIPRRVTYSIESMGTVETVVLLQASEILDPQCPDAHYAEVLRG